MRYLFSRLLLMLPTLFVILLINFVVVQIAPGGPIEEQLDKIASEQQSLATQGFALANLNYIGSAGLSDEMLAELQTRFGYDLPVAERFWQMLSRFVQFDLGESFFQGQSVMSLIATKLPITMLLGALSLMVMYAAGVMIGLYKARYHRTMGDYLTTFVLAILHALPVVVLALFLLVLLAGVGTWQIFPLQGVVSDNFAAMNLFDKAKDLLWHLTLPVLASSLGSVAGIAYLTKFGLLAEFDKPYVLAMRTRGLPFSRIIYRQVLKNALLPVVAQLPMVVVGVLFTGNLLIEVIFGIDGIGRLGFDAVMQRDYPLMFGILYVFTLISMLTQLLFDLLYHYLDPRVDFAHVG
ncbi:ABC transporter permease subunit [Moraxella cuniculi]|uniref:Inner membrane ABC transporter permease protein yejB n=1 Tax=Moraxella cuniculi TaxID=34061 RepID=A0A448GXI7_9GAMM|nr:ABC transporter permease subunit [Moraxella cuniculi]VEG13510.1 Inner membrane ABC transporter permease protein yejB [Moraxella cuniculi]